MTLDQFQRIAQLCSNTTWVRTYLTSFPRHLVLEIANLDGSDLARLRAELLDAGFCEVPVKVYSPVERLRFMVSRDDLPGEGTC